MWMRIVRRDPAGHDMKSLTSCQANKTKVRMRIARRDSTALVWNHSLPVSNRTRVRVRTVIRDSARPGIKSLTLCQANRIRVGVSTVKRDPAEPCIKESLTLYQVNRIRVGVRIVRRDLAGPDMKSLTSCQANKTRMGVRIVRRDPVVPGMKSLTSCQANKNEDSEKGLSWTWHEITHFLSRSTEPEQEWGESKRDSAVVSDKESLTLYQANRTRVWVNTVRRDPAGSSNKSLTSFQANRIRMRVRTVRRTQLDLAWNHSPTVKPTQPKWKVREKWPSWTWHEITHHLSSK